MQFRTKVLIAAATITAANGLCGATITRSAEALSEVDAEQRWTHGQVGEGHSLGQAIEFCEAAAIATGHSADGHGADGHPHGEVPSSHGASEHAHNADAPSRAAHEHGPAAARHADASGDNAHECYAVEEGFSRLLEMTRQAPPGMGEKMQQEEALIVDAERRMLRVLRRIEDASNKPAAEAAQELRAAVSSSDFLAAEETINRFVEDESKEAEEADAHALATRAQLALIAWVVPTASSLLVVGLLLWMLVRLLTALRTLRGAAVAVGAGRLDHRVTLSGNDELSGLAQAFEQMKTDLGKAREQQRRAEAVARDLARSAGKAEVASGVLHNVGNALNTVSVASSLIREALHRSKSQRLDEAVTHLHQRDKELGAVMAADPRGGKLLTYLQALARRWPDEVQEIDGHARDVEQSLSHIKVVIAKQQEHAKASGIVEETTLGSIARDVVELLGSTLGKQGIRAEHDSPRDTLLRIDRHRAMQILMNLVQNAKDSIVESGRSDGLVEITSVVREDGAAEISVRDNGAGISEEARKKLFQYGFTTKASGHGFGLHNSALLASEVGGSVTARSEGPGAGATFVLTLPAERLGVEPGVTHQVKAA